MTRHPILPALLYCVFTVAACSRADMQPTQKTVDVTATDAASPAAAPIIPAAVSGPNIPAATRFREVPPEDKLEPMDIANARLPGGAALPMTSADPVPMQKKAVP